MRRERAALIRTWIAITVGAFIVGILIIGVALFLFLRSTAALADENARTEKIAAERGELAEIDAAVTTRDGLEELRTLASSDDVGWRTFLTSIGSRMPPEVTLIEFSLSAGAAAGGDATSDVGASGTLTFIGPSPDSQAPTLAALRTVPGHLSSDAGGFVVDAPGVYEFTVTVSFDETVAAGAAAETSG